MKRPKALTKIICPGDFRVAWSFFAPIDLFFLYINFGKKSILRANRSKAI
jgi:hypothetical protein